MLLINNELNIRVKFGLLLHYVLLGYKMQNHLGHDVHDWFIIVVRVVNFKWICKEYYFKKNKYLIIYLFLYHSFYFEILFVSLTNTNINTIQSTYFGSIPLRALIFFFFFIHGGKHFNSNEKNPQSSWRQ